MTTRHEYAERLLTACEIITAEANKAATDATQMESLTRPIKCILSGGTGASQVTYRIEPANQEHDCEESHIADLLIAYADKLRPIH